MVLYDVNPNPLIFGSKEMHALNLKHSTLLKYLQHCTCDMEEMFFLSWDRSVIDSLSRFLY